MIVQTLKTMAKLALPVFFAAFALPAFAMDVTYTSTGEFCAAPGPCANSNPIVENAAKDSISIGTFPQFTYFGAVATTQTVNTPSQAIAGEFDVSVIGANPRFPPANEVFTLYITTAAGTGTFVGKVGGNVAIGSSNATITFSNTSIVLGGLTYTLDSSVYALPKISSPSHLDTIMMEVATPEPTFMALSGLGFAGLAFVAYRRRRTV